MFESLEIRRASNGFILVVNTEDDAKEFYLKAEELFLEISQNLKESGFYYREGKDASHAVLRRN